jgi:hypothetical protein
MLDAIFDYSRTEDSSTSWGHGARQQFIKVSPVRLANTASGEQYSPAMMEKSIENSTRFLFNQLVEALLSDTHLLSSLSDITLHPAFRAIVADLGRPALPFILERMSKGEIRVQWFPMLKRIAKCDPVPSEKRGRLRQMAREWIRWGKNNNFLAP